MGLFENLTSASDSVALIEVSSGSVGGGYLSNGKGGPALEFSVRVPVEVRASEEPQSAMLRALAEVDKKLILEGAPTLHRNTGSGSIREVIVSVGSPWQESNVHVERVEDPKPFAFTRMLLRDVLRKTADAKPGRISSGESVIATILNGYETNRPFGKEVKLADIIVLSSTIPSDVAGSIEEALRTSYHTGKISFVAFAACTYTVFRDVYPHEKDYLAVAVSDETTDIAFVKQGLLASVISVPSGIRNLLCGSGKSEPTSSDLKEKDTPGKAAAKAAWIKEILEALKTFSEEHPLPRTLFLLADEHARDYVKSTLDDVAFRTLWLSEEPLSILPVVPSHFLPYVKVGTGASGDTGLMMLALYHGKRIDELHA